MAITIAATFFLCFTAVHQGFEATPKAILDFALSTGASRGLILGKVRIPAAIPFLFAAARVTVARVFLGVTLAEYLATRQGLGALLFEARGTLDFGLMWLIACCAGMISLVLVGGVSFFEERALLRYV
jgi:ABC-type nitrate/sulfonate/bicarbonate transport system permease component